MKFHLTEETQHTCLTIQTKSVQLQFEIIAIFMEDDDWFYDDLYDDDNDIIDGDDDDSDGDNDVDDGDGDDDGGDDNDDI